MSKEEDIEKRFDLLDVPTPKSIEKSPSAEDIATQILSQQQERQKINENLIVSNFVSFFEPLIQNLDSSVDSLRLSQCELTSQIKSILAEISKVYEDDKKKLDLDDYTKRLVQSKKKINTIQATIISIQERLNRIFASIQKDPYLKQYRQHQQQQNLNASTSSSSSSKHFEKSNQ